MRRADNPPSSRNIWSILTRELKEDPGTWYDISEEVAGHEPNSYRNILTMAAGRHVLEVKKRGDVVLARWIPEED